MLLHVLILVNELLGVVQVIPYLLFSFHVCSRVLFEWLQLVVDWNCDMDAQDSLTILAKLSDPLLHSVLNISLDTVVDRFDVV